VGEKQIYYQEQEVNMRAICSRGFVGACFVLRSCKSNWNTDTCSIHSLL